MSEWDLVLEETVDNRLGAYVDGSGRIVTFYREGRVVYAAHKFPAWLVKRCQDGDQLTWCSHEGVERFFINDVELTDESPST